MASGLLSVFVAAIMGSCSELWSQKQTDCFPLKLVSLCWCSFSCTNGKLVTCKRCEFDSMAPIPPPICTTIIVMFWRPGQVAQKNPCACDLMLFGTRLYSENASVDNPLAATPLRCLPCTLRKAALAGGFRINPVSSSWICGA